MTLVSVPKYNLLKTHIDDIHAQSKISRHLSSMLSKRLMPMKPIFVCIGSDRLIGDCLGPLIGTQLAKSKNCIAVGTILEPVHAENLEKTWLKLQNYEKEIVVIDAALGGTDEVGNIEIWEGSIIPGGAVGNSLPAIGNIAITAVVNEAGQYPFLQLGTTRLSFVFALSQIIAKAILVAIAPIKRANGKRAI